MEYRIEEINDKKTWEDFVLSSNPQSFLQSWNWGETNRLIGNRIFRLGFFQRGKLVGVCLLVEQLARRGPHFLVPGGPIIDWKESQLVEFIIKTIKEIAAREGAYFVRIRPELLDSKENRFLFKRLGAVSAPMHLHAENTWVLDITPEEEVLLSGMRKTTRYLIHKSLNMGLRFEESINPKDADILARLQEETVIRHKFVGFPKEIFIAQLETFGRDNQASLFLCKKGQEVLSAAIIIFYNDIAYYHHSASTLKYPKIPASYFLQWHIIKEAKRRGCKLYNFWGIAPTDNPRHRFAGVTLFKKGFGGRQVDWLHAQDFPTSPFYWLTFFFELGRKFARRL